MEIIGYDIVLGNPALSNTNMQLDIGDIKFYFKIKVGLTTINKLKKFSKYI